MVVRIRLARFGKRNAPFYNIVVANARYAILKGTRFLPSTFGFALMGNLTFMTSTYFFLRSARNSKPIEVIGTYDPIPKPPPFGQGKPYKDIQLDTSRAKYWLGVGAQPSERAWKLLSLIGLLEPRYNILEASKDNIMEAPKLQERQL